MSSIKLYKRVSHDETLDYQGPVLEEMLGVVGQCFVLANCEMWLVDRNSPDGGWVQVRLSLPELCAN